MKITDAFWEKRNLGTDVTEITAEAGDNAETLCAALAEGTVPYSVVKIPAGSPELLAAAQSCGYRVVEMGIEAVGDLRRITVPRLYSRFAPHIRMERAEGAALDAVLGEIRRGEIFDTDRIAQDPAFSAEIAGRRYYNWCCAALEAGAFMGLIYYKDMPAAFNLAKEIKGSGGMLDGILGGVLPEAAQKGLGFLVVFGETEICRHFGAQQYLAKASSNNPPILRLHLQFGYELRSMSYVLVKHQ